MAAHVVLLFVDGVGVPAEAQDSPLADPALPTWRLLGGDAPPSGRRPRPGSLATLVPVDAGLGVPGLPQSATGQTTILTGVNAAARLGHHRGGQPTPTLIRLLRADNLFLRLRAAGRSVAWANAHPADYEAWFERFRQLWHSQEAEHRRVDLRLRPPDPRRPPWLRPSASAWAADAAGLRPRGPAEAEAGLAIPHDLGPDPREAGRRLARLARLHHLTYFEYWLTDQAGHLQAANLVRSRLADLDAFLAAFLEEVDLAETLLLVVSDHGNAEDLRSRRHTANPALVALAGSDREALAGRLGGLADVAGVVEEALGLSGPRPIAAVGGG
ncbi:MAG: hypothetical protein IRZ26_00790 [Clostridia bacterium]|nr:hypothetical protein [Clostridia bacterium]MCL6521207.1 hypothetical protein [Bacillota bacterium]